MSECSNGECTIEFNNTGNNNMQNYNEAVELAQTLVAQAEAYTNRPTKAESKRMRATLSALKKVATEAKRDLMQADNA